MASAATTSWEALPGALATALATQFDVVLSRPLDAGDHPALAWRRCGLIDVTGRPDGPGRVSPVPLTSLADAALDGLRHLAGGGDLPTSGALLLGERARSLGLRRQGLISANGSCRLLTTADGLVALNLPRVDDWDLASAMTQTPVTNWAALSDIVRDWSCDDLVERGRLLGLAIAVDRVPTDARAPFVMQRFAPPRAPCGQAPLVVDLSALWAGPLAGNLLGLAGGRVVKVESASRPDGARSGNPAFFDLLNRSKTHLALDFRDASDLAALRSLVRDADIVIEGSRPRALRDLGIDAQAEAARGATWLSITGHGRDGAAGDWIGFGDDAAVAGGLTSAMRASCGETLFVGDAVADPLTGILAALSGWAGWLTGGGCLVSLALADVVGFACGFSANAGQSAIWQAMADDDLVTAYRPR